MKNKKVFCDTSFFIRFTDEKDPLYSNANAIYKYLQKNNFDVYVSTIAVAEFCTNGDFNILPWDVLTPVVFDMNHAVRASDFAKKVFAARKKGVISMQRNIIPNDVKLFAQADCDAVAYFLFSDTKSKNIYDIIKPNFQFIDIGSDFDFAGISNNRKSAKLDDKKSQENGILNWIKQDIAKFTDRNKK